MTPETLAQTHAAAFTDGRPWTTSEFAELLKSPGVILRGDARSFLLGRQIADEAEVLTVATDPAFRRLGLATTCVAAFLDVLKTQDAARSFLEVAEDNEPAKSLYLKAGFYVAGRRPNYYTKPSGNKVAAIVMQCELNSVL